MAKFISHSLIIPQLSSDKNGSISRFKNSLEENAGFSQVSLMRSMNRNAMALAVCAHKLPTHILNEIKSNPLDVGIYCAVEQTSTQHSEIARFMNDKDSDIFSRYSKLISPRLAFQTSIGLVGSSLSILMGARGGVYTFHHPQYGCLQALQQAELDLQLGQIKYALLCTSNSAEDPILIEKYRRMTGNDKHFSEAAAIIILCNEDQKEVVGNLAVGNLTPSVDCRYGISTPLVNYFKEKAYEI